MKVPSIHHVLWLVALLLPGALTAQDPKTKKRLEALENELAAIRAELDAKEVVESGTGPTLTIRGYGQVSVSYEAEDEDGPASGTDKSAFAIGGLDLFLLSQLTDEVSFLSEIFFEGTDDGEFDIDVERLTIKYQFNDNFDIQAGRMYSSFGYWNSVYNHGEYLQTSIDRPEIIEFEDQGGFLPIHNVGVRLHTWWGFDAGTFEGNLEFGNGRGPVPDDTQLVEDENDSKSVNLHGTFELAAVEGLRFGAGLYFDKIPKNDDPSEGPLHGKIHERIYSASLVYKADPWEILGEFYYIYHDPYGPNGPKARSNGWYGQVARKFGEWTPYVRVDATHIDNEDTYFDTIDNVYATAIGVRFDFAKMNALTLQMAYVNENAPPGDNGEEDYEFILQWSFAF